MEANVLHHLSYGMYVVASHKDDVFNGQIANTVFQITSEPAMIAVSISKQNLTHEYIEASKHFSVSVLAEDTPLTFIGWFGFRSGRIEKKFKDASFKIQPSGCPVVLDNAISYLEAKVVNKFDCNTHTLFLGEVISSQVLRNAPPMTYAYYHEVKKGTTPQTAPTFVKEESPSTKRGPVQQKYRCAICNYIYDPAVGDPNNKIPKGVAFNSLPESWVCPVCAADKSQFEVEE
ncbi:MAG: flavin reductase [Candidatus Omnitrophota bacterium]|jgi:flavin reductase (DIM6/NTAB) family NADH-FMN oxidoreductase RutF/rubredoxin